MVTKVREDLARQVGRVGEGRDVECKKMSSMALSTGSVDQQQSVLSSKARPPPAIRCEAKTAVTRVQRDGRGLSAGE